MFKVRIRSEVIVRAEVKFRIGDKVRARVGIAAVKGEVKVKVEIRFGIGAEVWVLGVRD